MKRAAANHPNRSRSRKKTVSPDPGPTPDDLPVPETTGKRNVSPLEGGISTAAGILFLVAALFPRSLKQLLLLGIGGGLVYRGVTGKCGVYAALDIDTARAPLLKQINEKYLAPAIEGSAES